MTADPLHIEFEQETSQLVGEVEQVLLKMERDAAGLAEGWRSVLGSLHTIKGNCAMMRYRAAEQLTHAMEDAAQRGARADLVVQQGSMSQLLSCLDVLTRGLPDPAAAEPETLRAHEELRAGPQRGDQTPTEEHARQTITSIAAASNGSMAPLSHVQISAERIDRMLEAIGELSIQHNRAASAVHALARRMRSVDDEVMAGLDAVDRLGHYVNEFRQRVMHARLLPLSLVFLRFERVVRDVALALGKRARLEFSGAATVVDKSIVDMLGEPLLHIIRNAVTHGLEIPEQRRAAGKQEVGVVRLTAEQQGGELCVTVGDDGRGIALDEIRARARQQGIDADSDADALGLIFRSEISTSTATDLHSGRGVGLAAARRRVEEAGGVLSVTTTAGGGAEFRLRLPLNVALRRMLLVETAERQFAVPVTGILAAFQKAEIASDGARVEWRGQPVKVVDLAAALGLEEKGEAHVVLVVEGEELLVGLAVERVHGTGELVIKEMPPVPGWRSAGISGTSILADGRVALVLDPRWFVRSVAATRETPRELKQ